MSRCLSAGSAPLARTAGEQPQWTGPPGLRGPVPVPRHAHLPRTPTTLGSSRVSPGAVLEGVWDRHLELDWHFLDDTEDKPFSCLFGTQGLSACVSEVNWPGFLFSIRLSFYGFDALFVSQILVAHHICVMKTIFSFCGLPFSLLIWYILRNRSY